WGARADRLRAGASRLATTEHLPTYLALAGVAANATASGRRDEARRVAYRLPRELGAALLAALGENLAELAAAGREAWDRGLEEDCAELARRGLLRWPEPWEGLP
ncbi:MAG TPA: hypothetical protein VLX28_23640, partial [Thermoanaerobaculia bacterium]|nr:hypothetical protein [Thermoanaerobaculia bacterium]